MTATLLYFTSPLPFLFEQLFVALTFYQISQVLTFKTPMAVQLLGYQVADLCLGKPPLRSLSSSATVAQALSALKSVDDTSISIWNCDHLSSNKDCLCIGKLSMVDITTFLCKKDNLTSPTLAFNSPLSVLLSKSKPLVTQVEPTFRYSSSSIIYFFHMLCFCSVFVCSVSTLFFRLIQKCSVFIKSECSIFRSILKYYLNVNL